MEELYEFDEDSLNEEEADLEEKKKKSKGKKDACYHKVRARYDVWPSAYASGALVKCRKAGAANWGNKSKKKEGLELDDKLLQIIKEEYRAVLSEKKCSPCGRSGDEKRSKYPSCRPTPGACGKKGKWGKKSKGGKKG